MSLHPSIVWCQRKDRLLVMIKVKDCTDPQVKFFAEGRVSFAGMGGDGTGDKHHYAVELDLAKPIKPEESSFTTRPNGVDLLVTKAVREGYWDELTQGDKNHRIATDWDRLTNEEDEVRDPRACATRATPGKAHAAECGATSRRTRRTSGRRGGRSRRSWTPSPRRRWSSRTRWARSPRWRTR